MAHSQETRQAVRRSYVVERLSLEHAAERNGISYHTARAWKRAAKDLGDDWDRARTASRMAAGGLGDITNQVLEDFALLFQSTLDEIKGYEGEPFRKAEAISRLSDAYAKTMKAAGAGNNAIAELAVALKVLEELAKFIREGYPEQLETFTAILEPFGQRLSEVFA